MKSFLLYSYWRFQIRRLFRAHPVLSTSFVCVSFGLAIAVAFYFDRMHTARAVRQEFDVASRAVKNQLASTPAVAATIVAPALPWFHSTDLVAQFGHLAEEIKLPIDEIGYSLEESPNRPFLRYRVTLTVAASYPVIRSFVDALSETMKNVDLDSISCTRADIAVAPLTCELAFSAFFRKD
ncbi:hypothetical protein GTP55_13545 [Duganella sp. FT109W]|uniref:Type 4a pilus biogenesis protein PilO n=1 Tax=Duganella margarita TaxID=2692170 RepID=A0ABW9WJ32_9BURK|nr:hypothetical protein [Duganella margarita]MYN40398.1 hypothetical protein [Duganella margarita]